MLTPQEPTTLSLMVVFDCTRWGDVIPIRVELQETQLRFSPAVRRGKYGDNPSEVDMILYDIKSFDQQVRCSALYGCRRNVKIRQEIHSATGIYARRMRCLRDVF